jgi:hypothetical protein
LQLSPLVSSPDLVSVPFVMVSVPPFSASAAFWSAVSRR